MPSVINTASDDLINFGTASDGLGAGTITVDSNSQSFKTMTFGADSGAITFADSSAVIWGESLNVIGNLKNNSVRFGTSDSALTAAQISAIKINDYRAALSPDGYLKYDARGTLIMIY